MRHRAGLLLFPERGVVRRAPGGDRAAGAGAPSAGAAPVASAPPVAPAPPAPPVAPPAATVAPSAAIGRAAPNSKASPRYLLVHLPSFALERCGLSASDLAVSVAAQRGATRVVASTPAAAAEGIGLGMSITEARALAPALIDVPSDPDGERHDHADLVSCFAHLGERPTAWGEHDVLIEIGRTAHLLGGERAVVELAQERAAELGHLARCVIADDPRAASALAVWGDGDRIVPPGALAFALAPLPLQALGASPSLILAALVLGVATIGEWAALEPASVRDRFGDEGARLLALAQGRAVGCPGPGAPPRGPIQASAVLGGPTVALEPLLFVLPGLLRRVSEQLADRDAAAVRIALRFELDGAPAQVLRARVGQPDRDPERLLAVLRPRIERLRLAAPAVALHVEVEDHAAERPWQPDLLTRASAAEPLADLLARLSDTIGESCVFSPYLVDDWRPERAAGARPFAPGAAPPPAPEHRKGGADPVAIQRAAEPDGSRPRPLLLLHPPERVEVRCPRAVPIALRHDGRWWAIEAAEGPERLETGWWEVDGGVARDYWVLAIDGRTCWCFVDDQGRWYLHGWFD
jgi:protein ImuB